MGPTQLRIAWTTGERLEVDLAEPINRLKALAPLRDPAAFDRGQAAEWGHSLVWEGEIDLGADRLYERREEQAIGERVASLGLGVGVTADVGLYHLGMERDDLLRSLVE